MKKTMIGALTLALLLVGATGSRADMKLQKAAKEAGFASANCLFCHNEKLPAKGKVTNNARGEFLVKMKAEKKAKEIDVAWLKDFVEAKK